MPWELTAASAAGFTTLAVYAALALVGWRNRTSRCGPEVTLLMAVVGLSALTYSIQLGYDAVAPQSFWWGLTFAISTLAPFLWLGFVVQYVSRSQWMTRRRAAAFALEPLVMMGAIATNSAHGLVWTVSSEAVATPGAAVELAFGPLYYGHLLVAYVTVTIGMWMIFLVGIRWSLVYWKQVLVLLVAPLPPFLSNIAFVLGISPVPSLDLTPFMFTFTGLLLVLGLYRFDLLERVPIARRQAFQAMGDGLVVLNSDRVVIQVDDIARRILDPPPDVGSRIDDVFPETQFEQLHGTTVTDANNLAYDIRVSELTDERGGEIGYALALRDVTGRHRYEQRLEVANRVLRHNLRNDMNVVRGYADIVATGSNAETKRAARSILDRTDDLLTVSDKARKVSELDDSHTQPTTTHDVTAIVAGIVHQSRRKFPESTFTFVGTPHVEAELTDAGSLATAIEELTELLVGQADGENGGVTIQIAVERRDDVVIRIESDGPPIPAVEREALSAGSETPLRHAEGLGLWLAYWCVIENGGELAFGDEADGSEEVGAPNSKSETATVTLTFPAREE